jgi:hypothetical protein
MKGFKLLVFTLVYKGNDIEDGIESYETGCLDRKSVKDYGLEVLHITTSLHPRGRYTHAFIRINILIHLCTCLFMYLMHVHMCMYLMHVHICIFVLVCLCVYALMYVYVFVCVSVPTYSLRTYIYPSHRNGNPSRV